MLHLAEESFVLFFNEKVLLEKMTKEQYRRRNFKKKYHWEHDPDSKNPNIGYITDKDGNKIKISIDRFETDKYGNRIIKSDDHGNRHFVLDPNSRSIEYRGYSPNISKYDDHIHFGDNFFKRNKRSHRGAATKAEVDHEIGHYLLHRDAAKYAKNKTEQKKLNKKEKDMGSPYQYPISRASKNVDYTRDKLYGDIMSVKSKTEDGIYPNKKVQNERIDGWNAAVKYQRSNEVEHANEEEFEADRYAMNRMKPGTERYYIKDLKHTYEQNKKKGAKENKVIHNEKYNEARNKGASKSRAKEFANYVDRKNKDIDRENNKDNRIDYDARKAASSDQELKKNKSYK